MRFLRSLAATVLLAGCAVVSHAATSLPAFKTHVLDPPGTSFPTYIITSAAFTVDFTPCQSGELPGGNTADGCFAAINRSGEDFTALDFLFDNVAALGGRPASCAPAPSDNIYASTSCGLNAQTNQYMLDFSSGLLANGAVFFVTETGVNPALFPEGTATATTATPEPSSLLLLGSGCLLLLGMGRVYRTT